MSVNELLPYLFLFHCLVLRCLREEEDLSCSLEDALERWRGREAKKERCCSWRRWNGEINLAKRDGRADVFHILLSHLFSFLARSLARGAASRIIHLNSDLRSSHSPSVLILAESGGTRTTPTIVRTAISCVRATCITLRPSTDDDSGPRPRPHPHLAWLTNNDRVSHKSRVFESGHDPH